MAESIALFEREYCPPIDPALLSAILSDFDLTNPEDVQSAKATLDGIKLSAEQEGDSGFDPSGSSARPTANRIDVDGAQSDEGDSWKERSDGQSEGTDLTSVSNGLRSLGLDDQSCSEATPVNFATQDLDQIEKLDDATKELLLREMFSSLNKWTISHSLKKSNGRWDTVIEDLLNISFFESGDLVGDDKIMSKGIDAFSEDYIARRKRKGKAKKYRMADKFEEHNKSRSLPSTPPNGFTMNSWDIGRCDIDFISTRTQLPAKTVSSAYHQNGASVSAALNALLQQYPKGAADSSQPDEAIVQVNSLQLIEDFPTIPPSSCRTLIRLTHPSTAAAHELAKAMTSPRTRHPPQDTSPVNLVAQYAPLDLDSLNAKPATGSTTAASRHAAAHPLAHTLDLAALATTYAHLRHTALARASAAHRRGNSDRLMSSAAAYYSQLGRDLAAKRDAAVSEAAEAVVTGQSVRGEVVDLHGVGVADGVRIAGTWVGEWWRGGGGKGVMGLDGRRGMKQKRDGGEEFRVVTGVGRHSEGGVGKIGPAVWKALEAEGWRVTKDGGVLVVTGRKTS